MLKPGGRSQSEIELRDGHGQTEEHNSSSIAATGGAPEFTMVGDPQHLEILQGSMDFPTRFPE